MMKFMSVGRWRVKATVKEFAVVSDEGEENPVVFK